MDNISTWELEAGSVATMFVSGFGNGSVNIADAWEILMIFETSAWGGQSLKKCSSL